MGVGRVVGLVAHHCPMLLLRVAPFVLCRPLAASFCCPGGEIGGRKEPGRKCRFGPSLVACGLPSPASKKLVFAIVGGLVDVGLWPMACCEFGWMGLFELGCARDHCGSFSKVAIVLSRAGVQFVDLGVGCEWLGGDDGGDLYRGLPPCLFGWSAARAEARLLFALRPGCLLLTLCRGCHVCCQGFD